MKLLNDKEKKSKIKKRTMLNVYFFYINKI